MTDTNSKKEGSAGKLSTILALVISGFSLFYAYDANQLAKKTNKHHIVPTIDCYFSKDQKQETDLKLDIKNSSPIKLSSLSVDHIYIKYDPVYNTMGFETDQGPYEKGFGRNWHYKAELEPTEITSKILKNSLRFRNELRKLKKEDVRGTLKEVLPKIKREIDIFYFQLTYYKDWDSSKYEKRCLYFLDNGKIYTESSFRDREYYNDMMSNITSAFSEMSDMPLPPFKGLYKDQ